MEKEKQKQIKIPFSTYIILKKEANDRELPLWVLIDELIDNYIMIRQNNIEL